MREFKDEILQGEPRYRFIDSQGNVVGDNLRIEQITPVIQEGTPLNKPTYDNIQAYIKSTDRFNLLKTTVDTTLHGEYNKDLFPKTWETVTDGSKYRSGNVVISHDAEWDGKGPDAFDGNGNTWAGEARSNNAFSKTLNIDFGEEIKVFSFYIDIYVYIDSGSIKLQASKDNSSWVDIASFGAGTHVKNITVTNPDWYRYYRIVSTSGYNYYKLYELQTEKVELSQAQVLTSDLLMDSYDNNKIIQIETPADLDTTSLNNYININQLGNVHINGLLEPSTKYILYYTNGVFEFQPAIYPKVSDNFSAKTGTISHGATIPKTAGYNNYIYFVSFNSGTASANWNNNYEINGAGTGITCSVDQSTRVVTAQITSYIRRDNATNNSTSDGSANYIEIAWN